jgi:hypothetical protein
MLFPRFRPRFSRSVLGPTRFFGALIPQPLTTLCALLAAVTASIVPLAAQPLPEDDPLRLPIAGETSLRVLAPSMLELTAISSPEPGALPLNLPDMYHARDFVVKVDGEPASVATFGFKRRVLYAPVKERDLRVATEIYLQLAAPLPPDRKNTIVVTSAQNPLWPTGRAFTATTDPLRFNPAIHVNQEGYTTAWVKSAIIGYYLGTLGELPIPAEAGFTLVDARTGDHVFSGPLKFRREAGFTYSPRPYQNVWEADFSAFQKPGEYRVMVPGLGASLPFRIDDGIMMDFARTYELGLYHQRCGAADELPYTRFVHDACHTAPAEVPLPASDFAKAWDIIAKLDQDRAKADRPVHQLKTPEDQFYPFVKRGKIDVRGGHHDAGDYSKYTIDSAALVHVLMFAVDSLPGVAELDNLGIPESGDGIGDVLEEAKWEADFLAKLQDDDGGFFFLVYPRDRRYEPGVTPDHGDPQIVWPKNTSATAAAVAALAQCASSPRFKQQYPDVAARYLAQAERGWKFLTDAIHAHGKAGAYQRLTHYGDQFGHDDELAWAACELFVATGEPEYARALREWFPNPGDRSTFQWGEVHAAFSYGNALRSYAFAARSGRRKPEELDAIYLGKCELELRRAGDDALRRSQQSAYGTSLPDSAKRRLSVGWYFASDQAFDLTVAYQLDPKPEYAAAVLANLNYEAGCNPSNVCFLTGIGLHRQREIVHQYAQADRRVLPPSGLPLGSMQGGFDFLPLYKTELRAQSYPPDDVHPPYPLYDRWSDAYNVSTEFVVVNQGRSLASIAYWAAQTPLKTQPWKAATTKIDAPKTTASLNRPITLRLESPDIDLTGARIVWEARDQEPALGPTFTMTPKSAGPQWAEAEAQWPDGRRVFAAASFTANSPVVFWVEGALPKGATPQAAGGDEWHWIETGNKPPGLASRMALRQHESALADGIHEHGFDDAEATLAIDRGDVLFAYVYLDPEHPPKTLMLEWNDGSREHRAYWGPNLIPYGHEKTAGQRSMGPLPPTGRWVRLDVPASAVGLEGRIVKGMVFRIHSGRATWDAAGKMTGAAKELGIFPLPPLPNKSTASHLAGP